MPFHNGSLYKDEIKVSLGLGASASAPFEIANYEKIFTLESVVPKDTEEPQDVFLVQFDVALSEKRYKQVCKAPKTKNSRREVSIPRFLTDRLHNLMVEQTKNKESLGAYWKGSNWLFTQSDGSMMSYSTPYATFQDAIDRYNANKEPSDQLPHIPFHGLRHTSATLLIAAHQDVRTVSNR